MKKKKTIKLRLYKLVTKRKKIYLADPSGKKIMIVNRKFYNKYPWLVDSILYSLNRKLQLKRGKSRMRKHVEEE